MARLVSSHPTTITELNGAVEITGVFARGPGVGCIRVSPVIDWAALCIATPTAWRVLMALQTSGIGPEYRFPSLIVA